MQPNRRSNIVLIGMPGAGKSTVGVILAKQTSRDFVDTDLLIQTSERRPLQKILDENGHIALREIEERILLSLDLHNHVIATGGSAAYSGKAMRHLKKNGVVVFLHVPFAEIVERVRDFGTRGIAQGPGAELRRPLRREVRALQEVRRRHDRLRRARPGTGVAGDLPRMGPDA